MVTPPHVFCHSTAHLLHHFTLVLYKFRQNTNEIGTILAVFVLNSEISLYVFIPGQGKSRGVKRKHADEEEDH